jgi:hypothetical protein
VRRKGRLFLSYGRRDAKELADRLCADLAAEGYEVWRDTREIRPGTDWQQKIVDGLRSTQILVALLSPHAVRVRSDPNKPDNLDSVCLDELSFARFAQPPTPIVPENWRYGSSRDAHAKIHPDLVPWDSLKESLREYNRESCRQIPEFLASLGLEVFRIGEGGH